MEILEDLGVDKRSLNGGPVRFPLLHDRDWMRERYIAEALEVREIAQLLGCSTSMVKQMLVRLDLYDPKYHRAGVDVTGDEILEAARESKSLADLLRRLGVVRATFDRCRQKAGLSLAEVRAEFLPPTPGPTTREGRAALSRAKARAKEALREEMVRLYVEEGLTIEEIGARIVRHPTGVWRWLRRSGVDTSLRRRGVGGVGDGGVGGGGLERAPGDAEDAE